MDISPDDARAEGIGRYTYQFGTAGGYKVSKYVAFPEKEGGFPTAKEAFAALWDSIYAKRGLGSEVNPWVWACEFRRVSDGD